MAARVRAAAVMRVQGIIFSAYQRCDDKQFPEFRREQRQGAFAYLMTKIRSSIFVLCSICLIVSVQSWSNDAGLAPAP